MVCLIRYSFFYKEKKDELRHEVKDISIHSTEQEVFIEYYYLKLILYALFQFNQILSIILMA